MQPNEKLRVRSFVLAAWPSCSRRQPAASELAVVPPATPGPPSSNAWQARLRRARPHHIPRRTHSAHFTACRAAPLCAPISKYANGPSYVDQPSRSKLALSRKSLSNVAILDIWISQGKPDELEILTTDTLLYGGFFARKATRTIDSSGVMLDRYFQPLSWKRG